jgi:hypothetical protein
VGEFCQQCLFGNGMDLLAKFERAPALVSSLQWEQKRGLLTGDASVNP